MGDYPFDTDQVPSGPMDTLGVKWPIGTRYLVETVSKCRFYEHCGVERAGLVTTNAEKQAKPSSSMDREGYWYTLCPEHYAKADADYLPDWPNP